MLLVIIKIVVSDVWEHNVSDHEAATVKNGESLGSLFLFLSIIIIIIIIMYS